MYTFTILTAETATRYAGLTYPRYRNALSRGALPEQMIAIGAAYFGLPVGLVLGGIAEDQSIAQVESLVTIQQHRGKGVAQRLLAKLYEELKRRKCEQVNLFYVNGKPTTPALEHILEKDTWTPSEPITIVAHSDLERVREHLTSLELPLPGDVEIFAWKDLTTAERSDIERREQEPGGWYTNKASTFGSVTPFFEEDRIDPISSIGLHYHGSVIGWMITHRISAQAIRYTSLFVSPELRDLNLGITLILTAVKRHARYSEATGEVPEGYLQAAVNNRWMRQFIEMAAPLWLAVEEHKVASKWLSDNPGTPQVPSQITPDFEAGELRQ